MIVRIQGEGQYELGDSSRGRLEELDRSLFKAVDEGDSNAFGEALKTAIGYVESNGSKLEADRLAASDIILPPSDISIEEAKRLFTDEGYLEPVEA